MTEANSGPPVVGDKTGTGYFVPNIDHEGQIASIREATRSELRQLNPAKAQMLDLQDAVDDLVLASLLD